MANNNQIYKMSNAGGFKSLNRYYDMLAGNTTWSPWSPTGAYDALATVTVPSGGVASVTFSGIPQTYKHLQVRATLNGGGDYACWLNGDTALNYNRHILYGTGSGSAQAASDVSYGLDPCYAVSLGGFVQDFLDYTSTSKYKTARSLWGYDANGSGYVGLYSGLWRNTSAITSIQYVIGPGGNIPQYTQFTLYGIK